MGVIRKFDEARPIRIEDSEEINYADYDLTESDNEEDTQNPGVTTTVSRSRRRREERAEKKLRKFLNDVDTDGITVKRNMGARKWRRVENARLLLAFVDKDDICQDFSDIVPQSMSVFAKLFEERENMRVWNEFIRLEEDDQSMILQNAGRRNWADLVPFEEEKTSGDGWCVLGGRSASNTPRKNKKEEREEDEDQRNHHPAYSAKACFDRIDTRFKQLFKQRSLPWAFIDKVERELRHLYMSDSDAVFVAAYESGLDRMLVHAVVQYLMLTSKSVTDKTSQERITEVRNPRSFFVPPREELIKYLEKIRNQKIDFVRDPEFDDEDVLLKDLDTSSGSASEPEFLDHPSAVGSPEPPSLAKLTLEDTVHSVNDVVVNAV